MFIIIYSKCAVYQSFNSKSIVVIKSGVSAVGLTLALSTLSINLATGTLKESNFLASISLQRLFIYPSPLPYLRRHLPIVSTTPSHTNRLKEKRKRPQRCTSPTPSSSPFPPSQRPKISKSHSSNKPATGSTPSAATSPAPPPPSPRP